MHPERRELVEGVKMAAVAVVSAVVTATAVISLGQALETHRTVEAGTQDVPTLIRTAG